MLNLRGLTYSVYASYSAFITTIRILCRFLFRARLKRLQIIVCTSGVVTVVTTILMFIPFVHSVHISEFTRVREHTKLQTVDSGFDVISLLDCSTSCSLRTSCDGFNFKNNRSLAYRRCAILTFGDISYGVLIPLQDSYVYVKLMHVETFEQAQVRIIYL